LLLKYPQNFLAAVASQHGRKEAAVADDDSKCVCAHENPSCEFASRHDYAF
jgi:hypothetical protein